MKARLNIDILGGLSVLAICAFFYLQFDEDFSMFGLFFPKRILPLLVALGAAIIVKGFIRPSRPEKPVFRINWTMLSAMLIGAAWVLLLEPVGFVLTSFIAVFGMQVLYMERSRLSVKSVLINLVGSAVAVLFFNHVFVQYLGVTLPAGILKI